MAETGAELMESRRQMLLTAAGPRASKRPRSSQDIQPKWVQKHEAWFGELSVTSVANWSPDLRARFPEHDLLTDRELELLDSTGIQWPEPRKVAIDLSQSKANMAPPGCIATLIPGNRTWLAWRGRLLRGCEAMALQGMPLPAHVRHTFSSSFLMDLAGNAFSTPCVLAATLLQLTVLGLLWRMSLTNLAGPRVEPSSLVLVDTLEDSDSEECDFSQLAQ